ncbi:hypothetical protein LEP1GSC132_2310 [Leptospira kirschneri str. 200803703]|nr:hypothetical protein LEP1GSC044_0752 [Leptospira kirschneri serovar Grippotyphosa str. RM52]EKQ83153.1 hypothetical protein LEP1GSC064_1189 [Leptospira kirschneri serovar Grippotyphosa str. Moskva]EKR08093.1 hypothetical protein LEP1GSC122_2227 [Leptospira kirschneri serovar Valbuzzi str. 200702274]EMK00713.1 hypothetical protein LEP1GSC176_0792 [Leptospira kirschneri str. MMD1493]EMK18672.1 hypothetical protein LEP1GSC042_1107 [Leptospira kirschneri serovar Bim str. PUO 1247]EMN06449.1 hyp
MNFYKMNFEFSDKHKTTILRKNLISKFLFLDFIMVYYILKRNRNLQSI